MKQVAVIIEHPFRDYDWRVDIYHVPDAMTRDEVWKHAEKKMLGPFRVVSVSEKIGNYSLLLANQ